MKLYKNIGGANCVRVTRKDKDIWYWPLSDRLRFAEEEGFIIVPGQVQIQDGYVLAEAMAQRDSGVYVEGTKVVCSAPLSRGNDAKQALKSAMLFAFELLNLDRAREINKHINEENQFILDDDDQEDLESKIEKLA